MPVFNVADVLYPRHLKYIPNPPQKLFYECNFCLKADYFKNCLAIIGSREMTSYGKDVLGYIFKDLDKSITIVSGFMTGVDAYSHRLALAYGMKTVAVLPGGINKIYPTYHKNLYRDLLTNGGLLMSEYPKSTNVQRWMFCRRNRIIAGMCLATLVIEASLDSGSLLCADYANSFGRRVFVVPGSIFNIKSHGTNLLAGRYGVPIFNGVAISEYIQKMSGSLFGC